MVQDECYESQECAGDYKYHTHTVMNDMGTASTAGPSSSSWGIPQNSMTGIIAWQKLPTDKHLVLFDKYKNSLEILRKEGYNAGYHVFGNSTTSAVPTWTYDQNFVPDRVLLYDSVDHWQVQGFDPYFKEMSYTNI